jgi:hypothetical protein
LLEGIFCKCQLEWAAVALVTYIVTDFLMLDLSITSRLVLKLPTKLWFYPFLLAILLVFHDMFLVTHMFRIVMSSWGIDHIIIM